MDASYLLLSFALSLTTLPGIEAKKSKSKSKTSTSYHHSSSTSIGGKAGKILSGIIGVIFLVVIGFVLYLNYKKKRINRRGLDEELAPTVVADKEKEKADESPDQSVPILKKDLEAGHKDGVDVDVDGENNVVTMPSPPAYSGPAPALVSAPVQEVGVLPEIATYDPDHISMPQPLPVATPHNEPSTSTSGHRVPTPTLPLQNDNEERKSKWAFM